MRNALLSLLLFLSQLCSAQINYDCHNQSNLKANWQYLGPVNNTNELPHQRFGVISCLSVNPTDSNEIYVGNNTGALMHTSNRGKTWQSLTDHISLPIIGVNDILVNYKKTPHEIIIATGSSNDWYDTPSFGILKSKNGGLSWQQKKVTGVDIPFQDDYKHLQHAGNLIIAHSTTSIIQSHDQGESWQKVVHGDMEINDLKLKEREIRHSYYDVKNNRLFFSTKQKWVSTGNEIGLFLEYSFKHKKIIDRTPILEKAYRSAKKNNGFEAIQIIPQDSNKLLLVASNYNSPELFMYEYAIGQNKVTDYDVPNAGRLMGSSVYWYHGMEVNKINPRIRYIGGVYLFKSHDGGQQFDRLFGYSLGDNNIPHVDIRSMFITHHSTDGKNDHLYLGTDGGLSFSNNGGKTFRNLNGHELQLTQFYGLGSSPFTGIISAGSQDNSIISYIPDSKKWIYNVRGDGYDVAYSKIKPGVAYGQYNSRSLFETVKDTVPFGRSKRIREENSNNRKTIYTHPNGDLFFASKHLYHLPKGESRWKKYKMPLDNRALAFAVSKSNPEIIYVSGQWSQLLKSTDGGNSWDDISNSVTVNGAQLGNRIMSICISPYDEDRVWLGLGYQGAYDDLCKETIRVISTNDGGDNWINTSDGLPVFAVQDIQFYEGSYESLFLATEQGVYFKRGNGYKWQLFNDNLPHCLIGELNINYCRGKLLAATFGRGLWETDLPIIQDSNPLIIRRKVFWQAPKGEALVINRDVIIKGRGQLSINCPVYMPYGSKIKIKRSSQVKIMENGLLLNGCGDHWQGVLKK